MEKLPSISAVQATLSRTIQDRHQFEEKIRPILDGNPVLKESTLKNWRMQPEGEKIPRTAIDGAFLALAVYRQDSAESKSEDVPTSLKSHAHAIETTGMWAKKMWNVLRISPPEEKNGMCDASVIRFWEGITVLPNRTAWLVHCNRLQNPNSISAANLNLKQIGLAQDKDPFDILPDSGVLCYAKELENNENLQDAGYQFDARNAFRSTASNESSSEFFACQTAICCEEVIFVVSIPESAVQSFPLPLAAVFAPISMNTPIEYIVEVMQGKILKDGEEDDIRKFQTWGGQHPRSPEIARVQSEMPYEVPEALKDVMAELFSLQSSKIFHVRFKIPNPLTYESIFWRLPKI